MKKFTFIIMVSLLMAYSLITLTLMSCSNEFEVYRVSFDSQGGSPVAAVDVAKGLKVGEPKSPIRDGYEFAGWYRESECINEWSFISSVVHSQISLYAKWIADSYLVIYHTNGATDGLVPIQQVKIRGVDLTLASNTGELKRSGYIFGGWNAEEDGSGTDYAEGDTYSADSNLDLYAKWSSQSYPISYDANEATDGTVPVSQSKPHGVNITLATETGALIRTGYYFAGWNTQPDGSGTEYAPGNLYTIDSSIILYAHWIPQYTVTFDAQDGMNLTLTSKIVTFGYDYGLLASVEKDGYSFKGWWTGIGGTGTEITEVTIVSINSNQTLYAYWVPQYTVTFNAQDGTNLNPTSKMVIFGYDYGLLASVEKDGYSFKGWWTGIGGTGTEITEVTIVSINSNQTLYAYWVPQYTVTFNAQGGINLNPITKVVAHGYPYGELASTIKVGHSLVGWTTGESGTGTLVTKDSMVSVSSDHTLYAKWVPNDQTITFDAQGGSEPNPIIKVVTYGQTYGELATATRDGYTFAGWWTGAGGSGTQVTDSEVFTKTTNQTLYAKWIYNVFTGPAGGLVFYENPNWETDGWRYLEATPYGWYDGATDSNGAYSGDDDPRFEWGAVNYEVDPPATATAIGSGASNTANIVNYHDTLWTLYPEKGDYYTNPTDYDEYNDGTVAAKICADYELENGGITYCDWFLPSKDELNLMFKYLRAQDLGNFSEDDYWSSSEYAWSQSFYNGQQYLRSRSARVSVRPIRTF